ncbi:MAG TPA: fructose-bisphosphate aldolase, partial [Flavobacteriales bacterium]|nr:fructose-bisphosphate aldolase [Flavobacteriales bacterium]
MLEHLGAVASECQRWGMPLLAMMYPQNVDESALVDAQAIAIRIAFECGADVVKIENTARLPGFEQLIKNAGVPVLVSGGPFHDGSDATSLLTHIELAINHGASGLSVGRHVFQRSNRIEVLQAFEGIVHRGMSAHEAASLFGSQ